MLPGSTSPRKRRERGGKVDGRTTEIQRLIGRSLRAVADLEALGERLITVDCDVLEADGGTRTASITGGFIALVDALRSITGKLPDPHRFPLRDSVAAVSVGIVDGRPVLDLDYAQDVGRRGRHERGHDRRRPVRRRFKARAKKPRSATRNCSPCSGWPAAASRNWPRSSVRPWANTGHSSQRAQTYRIQF